MYNNLHCLNNQNSKIIPNHLINFQLVNKANQECLILNDNLESQNQVLFYLIQILINHIHIQLKSF